MFTQNQVICHQFEVDQYGIDELKNQFYDEARDFLYFRKGEWTGVLSSVQFALEWAVQNYTVLSAALAAILITKEVINTVGTLIGLGKNATERIQKALKEKSSEEKPEEEQIVRVDRKVICCEGINPDYVEAWEELNGKGTVGQIPKIQGGPLRYVLNEKRYAIFTRVGEQDLRGIIGYDANTIIVLKKALNKEMEKASK